MSSHFTYEMDERKIRLQLKGNVIEPKEEDWQKFETLLSGNARFMQESNFSTKLNITLSRNVVMPVIFGLVIVAFSILLVNFMSIKTQVKQDVPKTADQVPLNSLTEKQEDSKQNNSLAVSTNTAIPEKDTEKLTQEPLLRSQTENLVVPEITKKSLPDNSIEKKASDPQPELVNENQISNSATPEQAKKKRKKRLLESIESEQTSELRPTLVSEDRESEERPD